MQIAKDKIKHFAACAVVSLIGSAIEAGMGATYLPSLLAGFLAGVAIGVGKEYGDHCAASNHWDWADIGADVIGSLIGAALGSVLAII